MRLYYLRDLRGKKARLRSKVRDLSGLVAPADSDPEPVEEPAAQETVAEAAAADEAETPETEEAAAEAPAESDDEKKD